MKRLLLVALVLLPLVGVAGSAGAVAPAATAYWVKLGTADPSVPKGGLLVGDDPLAAINPAQPPTLPVALPVAPPPVNPPGPQLTGFTAVSGLHITGVAPDAPATLTLLVAQPSVPPLPSVSTIVACPLAAPWSAVSGSVGDISKAPASNCGSPSPGRVAGDLSAISWILPASFQTAPGEFDILLQPGSVGYPAPFLVAFNAPGASSVKAAAGGPILTPPPPADVTSPAPVATATPPPGPFGGLARALAAPSPSPPLPVTTSGGAATTSNGTPTVQVSPISGIALPHIPDDRAHRIMAVTILFVLAAAMWWLGGRDQRGPRRVGSLAGGPGGAVVAPASERGIGRFRRPRSGRSHRLM